MPASHEHNHEHVHSGTHDTSAWLASAWPFVREHLPPAPARVLEIGCGPLGGFVPAMRADGYEAVGIDPSAPDGPAYRQAEFETHEVGAPFNAIVASLSLHHVSDLNNALDRIGSTLGPGGALVVVEWAHERFDEPTARWCFDRLGPAGVEGGDDWLHGHRDRWHQSGQPWAEYFAGWQRQEAMHPGRDIVAGLQARFDTRAMSDGPYFFADLDGVTAEQEQAAIDSQQIQATGIRYVGQA